MGLRDHCMRWSRHGALPMCFAEWAKVARCARTVARRVASVRYVALQRSWQVWSHQLHGTRSKDLCAVAFRQLRSRSVVREALQQWWLIAQRRVKLQRLAAILEKPGRLWMREPEWRVQAIRDSTLRAMFVRFSEAFDQRRTELLPGIRKQSLQTEAFEALISLIWSRQQLSVALGRFRGYPQPWVLGAWPCGLATLLPTDSPYYLQAELRMDAMVSQVESEELPERAFSLYRTLQTHDSSSWPSSADMRPLPRQRLCMWQALADIIVVYHPGWPTACRPATGALRVLTNGHVNVMDSQALLAATYSPASVSALTAAATVAAAAAAPEVAALPASTGPRGAICTGSWSGVSAISRQRRDEDGSPDFGGRCDALQNASPQRSGLATAPQRALLSSPTLGSACAGSSPSALLIASPGSIQSEVTCSPPGSPPDAPRFGRGSPPLPTPPPAIASSSATREAAAAFNSVTAGEWPAVATLEGGNGSPLSGQTRFASRSAVLAV